MGAPGTGPTGVPIGGAMPSAATSVAGPRQPVAADTAKTSGITKVQFRILVPRWTVPGAKIGVQQRNAITLQDFVYFVPMMFERAVDGPQQVFIRRPHSDGEREGKGQKGPIDLWRNGNHGQGRRFPLREETGQRSPGNGKIQFPL